MKHALSPTRSEDFPEWFQEVIKAADMAEHSPVRGCMVIKPWGYGIWENIQRELDTRIKATGHQNAYFPLFIPLSYFEREAKHIEGFAKECAVVTHHRLEDRDGKLVPTGELEEPLIVRPTSEIVIGEAFSRWVNSYRDLPLLINQWANVVRWEMRPRLFLRTTEFLWQEGHTAHATAEEALAETKQMLEVYREVCEEVLAIPVIAGEKSPGEKFPGAENTFTLEAMMQDGKALQACTSHYLGQSFSKACNIRFSNSQGQLEYAYTTSWGFTTRMIGALVMCHGDDDGLRLPPRIAPHHAVIIPVVPKPELEGEVMRYADQLAAELRRHEFAGKPLSVFVDKSQKGGGEKKWEWIKKGIPLRIEVGPRDIEAKAAMVSRRDSPHTEKRSIGIDGIGAESTKMLGEIQKNYFEQAKSYRDAHIETKLSTFEELKAFFASKEGFVRAKWCGDAKSEKLLEELKATIRCIPIEQQSGQGRCILTGENGAIDAIFAIAY